MKHVLAIAILFAAAQAHAFEVGWPGGAAQPVAGSCSGCVKNTVFPTAVTPTDVFQVPLTGGTPRSFMYHQKVPHAAGGPAISVRMNAMRLAILDAGNSLLCFTVCAGVVKADQNADDLNLSACSEVISTTSFQSDQWDVQPTVTGAFIPNDTTGTPCSTTVCNDAELFAQVNILPNGLLCVGGITDTIGILGVYPNFVEP